MIMMLEVLDDVILFVLIKKHQRDGLLEGPWQEGIILPSHNGEEEEEVLLLARAISIHVQSQYFQEGFSEL